jgi:hypothetical protein
MPDDLDIFNEDGDDGGDGVLNGDEDDEYDPANDPEYLEMMHYLMFINGP